MKPGATNTNPPKRAGVGEGPTFDGLDSLRLDQLELERLHQTLNAKGGASDTARREWGRSMVRLRLAEATFHHPGGTEARCVVSPRDISAGGVGFLHGGFVYEGTPCTVHLKNLSGREVDLEGNVMRCRHIGRRIHEVGVKFHDRVDPREFMTAREAAEAFTLERVSPDKLEGKTLIIEPDRTSQRLIAQFLKPTKLLPEFIAEEGLAVQTAQQGFDAIIIGDKAGGVSAVATLAKLREARVSTPVVTLLTEESADALEAVRKSGSAAALFKPISEALLHRALGEFLLLQGQVAIGSGAITSTLRAPESRELVECFVRELDKAADDLDASVTGTDATACRNLCLTLKANGAPHGFKVISDAAEAALAALGKGESLEAAGAEVRRLVEVCRRCTAN